ncbi:hypothetical protein GYMLUDRAFT_102828, partial [Collybiopsis luxurians FD-317 M1]
EVLRDLRDWAAGPDLDKSPIYWISGRAGAGKSVIAQTIAQDLAKSGQLLGSFRFSRSDSSRNNPNRLFTTIAMQMAIAMSDFRSVVNSAVLENPSLLTSSIETQFEQLLVQPWLKVQSNRGLSD